MIIQTSLFINMAYFIPTDMRKTKQLLPSFINQSCCLFRAKSFFSNIYYIQKLNKKMFWKSSKEGSKMDKKKSKTIYAESKACQTECSERGSNGLGQFRREVEENFNKIRCLSQSMKYVNSLCQVQKMAYPTFYFSSIKKYFAGNLTEWQKDLNSNIILQSTASVYLSLARSKKVEKELSISIYFYLQVIRRILRNQDHDEDVLASFTQNAQNLRNHSPQLLRMFEDIIRLTKKVVRKEDPQQNIFNQLQQLKRLMLKKEDILPELGAIRNKLERGQNCGNGHHQPNGSLDPHDQDHSQLPQKYKVKQLEKLYQKQQQQYQANKRYWVNEVGEKNIKIAQLEETIRRLNSKLQRNEKHPQTQFLKSQIERLQKENKQKEKKQHSLMDKIHEKTYKLKLCEQINEYYLEHEQEHKMKLAQMSAKIIKARDTNTRNAELTREVNKLTQTIIGLERYINQKDTSGTISSEHSHLAIQLQAERNKNKELQIELTKCHEKLSALQRFVGEQKSTLFAGSLLLNRAQERKFLLHCIENDRKVHVHQTRLLYDLQRDWEANLVTRINGIQNLVVLIKTSNALIACYYSGMYQQYWAVQEQALIISLDSRKFYSLKSRMGRAMIFDKEYLIFGNEDIKLKAGSRKLKSNFGSPTGFFDSKNDNASTLLRVPNPTQVEVLNFQIYEVTLDEKFKSKDWL